MAKGKGESMSDEEKEIDIESDEVTWLMHCYGLGSHTSIESFLICLIFF